MSLRDIIAHDVKETFLNTEDFADKVWYKPQDGAPAQIPMSICEEIRDVPFPTAQNMMYHERDGEVSVQDVPKPLKLAVDGGRGDKFQFPDGSLWFLIDIPENGHNTKSGTHKLMLRDQKIPLG